MVERMLDQANHWLEIVGTAFDGLLLCRILLLRLQRVYLFITLACVLELLFDGVGLWLGSASQENFRVFLYSRYLYALIYPLVAWDVFEELKDQISKLRRAAIHRLISGMIVATIFGLIVSIFVDTSDNTGEPVFITTFGLVLWAASCTATLAFLWTIQKQIREQKIPRPNNTFVWMIYYELTLIGELLTCLSLIIVPLMNTSVADVLDLLFLSYGIAITGWCIFKLRGLGSGVPSTPQNQSA